MHTIPVFPAKPNNGSVALRCVRLAMLVLLVSILLLASATSSKAALVTLDLSSGTDGVTGGTLVGFDTYQESGFQLKMDRAGDHYDRGYIGVLGFHNGPNNQDDISWTLSFGGSAFDLLSINIAGFVSATSVTLTGSNGASQILSSVGLNAVAGLSNVTFVTFNIDQDGGSQAVGLNSLSVDNAPVRIPEAGSSLALLGFGVAGLTLLRRKRA